MAIHVIGVKGAIGFKCIEFGDTPPQYSKWLARDRRCGRLFTGCIWNDREAKLQQLVVDLVITADEYSKLYSGAAKSVFARARDGRSVRFPAKILQPFVTHTGIRGSFVIHFDQSAKFQGITRL